MKESDKSEDENENVISVPRDLEQAIPILYQCWNSLQPPQEEAVLKNCHYAIIDIDPKKKQSMFIGKVQHRWLHDELYITAVLKSRKSNFTKDSIFDF